MSRRQPPKSPPRTGQDEKSIKNRIHIGQIGSVDTANGQVVVRLATTGEEFKLEIPLGGFSIRGLQSSWMRYMPQRNEFVKVGFELDNTPRILAYGTFGEEFSPTGERQGSISAPRQGSYATVRRLAEANEGSLGLIFRELKEGEWDMRSSGGAEIYGSRNGTLTIAGGGGASMRLVKSRGEELHRSSLLKIDEEGVQIRAGVLRRKNLPIDAAEADPFIRPNPAAFLGGSTPTLMSTLREYKTTVGFASPPLGTPFLKYYEHDVGTPMDDLGAPVLAVPSPLPGPTQVIPFPPNALRARTGWFALDGLVPALKVEVDFLGNVQVEQLPTAPIGISLTAARLFLHANTTTATLASNLPTLGVFLGSESGLLSTSGVPGANATPQAYVLGTVWAAADSIMNGVKVTQHGVISAAHTAMAAAFIAIGQALTAIPVAPAPPEPVAHAVRVALIALANILGVQHGTAGGGEAAIGTAITTFTTAGLPTHFLSVKVMGE